MHLTRLVLCILAVSGAAPVAAIEIAADGRALLPVITSAQGSPGTKAAAGELAAKLSAITGGTFTVQSGDATTAGIIVGTAADFPTLAKDERLTSTAITDRENYSLRSGEDQLIVIGSTDLAVQHAVWDLLQRFGYRQFFPGKNWEVIPRKRSLRIDIARSETPAFHARSIWPGYGVIDERKEDVLAWNARNRATKGVEVLSGHAYDRILSHHKAEFEKHPEWLALVGGKRQGSKFCISNPGLRALVVQDALEQLRENPGQDCISCEPSDGGGWCECAECAKLGSVSDRALILSNEVARAIAAKPPGKLVGQYAYNEHSPAPSIDAEGNVVISIAAGFIKGGYTMDQLLEGWSAKAQTLGIREYYSVWLWDHDMPGQARGARLDYVAESIPHFHELGARYMSAEASDNWGCNGLGYYLASRILWDTNEANNVEAVFDDFLNRAFGPAKLPMSRFYTLINRTRPPESDDLIGRMYRQLKDASELEIDDCVRARIDDLILYTRACELWLDYNAAKGDARQKAMEALLQHAWRMRTSGMIHTMALWRAIKRDASIKIPTGCEWQVPAGKNPWKTGDAYGSDELDAFVQSGIENRAVAEFEPASFSSILVPATKLKLRTPKPGNFGTLQRGTGSYWTWVDKAPAEIHLQVTAGLVYQNQGDAIVRLFPDGEAEGKSVSEGRAAPDKQPHEIILRSTFTGLHRIELEDRRAGSRIEFPAGLPATFNATVDQTAALNGRHDLYFYVPAGTRIVGGFADGPGRLIDGAGKLAHEFTNKPGYFQIAVPEGTDRMIWKFEFTSGRRVLLTVPPQMARSAEELLLPAEVVEKDAK